MDASWTLRVRKALSAWYEVSRRDFPWRRRRTPYRVLLSEVLLQQTRAAVGTEYFRRFHRRFPGWRALAEAPVEQVLEAWAGLGYYGRARRLHALARIVHRERGGRLPRTAAELVGLPGIGPYTAAAVASIAFGEPVAAVDGNVRRVVARLLAIDGDPARGAAARQVETAAGALLDREDPGAWNEAVMELGATVCMPRSPQCGSCPLSADCLARSAALQDRIPGRGRETRWVDMEAAWGLVRLGGRVLLARRGPGRMEGLWELPGCEAPTRLAARRRLPAHLSDQVGVPVRIRGGAVASIRHTVTRHRIVTRIYDAEMAGPVRSVSALKWWGPGQHAPALTAAGKGALEALGLMAASEVSPS